MWAIASVVVVYTFAILHTAPYVYERISTYELAKATDADPAARYWFWDKTRMSFEFYVGRSVKRTSPQSPSSFEELLTDMASEHRVYCLVHRQEMLEELRAACRGYFFVIAESHGYWLVSNRPVDDEGP